MHLNTHLHTGATKEGAFDSAGHAWPPAHPFPLHLTKAPPSPQSYTRPKDPNVLPIIWPQSTKKRGQAGARPAACVNPRAIAACGGEGRTWGPVRKEATVLSVASSNDVIGTPAGAEEGEGAA